MSAALLRRAVRTWRSRQLTLTLSLPPTNHFAKGGFHSSTRFHGADHSSSRAKDSQKPSGSRSASSYTEALWTVALALNSADASMTRLMEKRLEVGGVCHRDSSIRLRINDFRI